MPSLIYVADPMCSWCYGFAPELAALLEGLPDMPLEIIVGGLRPYHQKVMDDEFRGELLKHWKNVADRTGLPFSESALAREDFIYDTEPACRAVVASRMLAPETNLFVFHAIQRAFYVDGQDTTDGNVLAEIASAALTKAGVPTDAATFLATWSSDVAIAATRDEFVQVQRWGISGFPTLILERDGKLDLVTSGYVAIPQLVGLLQDIIDRDATDSGSSASA